MESDHYQPFRRGFNNGGCCYCYCCYYFYCCRCLSVHLTHAPFLTCHYFSRQPRNQLEKLYKLCKFAFGIWFIYSIRRIGYYCDSCNCFSASFGKAALGGTNDWSIFRHFYATYRVPQKKCPIAIFSLNLFPRSDFCLSHVFRNQNFEPVPSEHFKHTHSEY